MAADTRARTRQEAAVAWCGAHVIELAGVSVPLIGGVVLTPWLELVAAALAGLWAANEIRLHRTTRDARRAALATSPAPHQLAPANDSTAPAPAEGTDRKEAKA
ncbi:conjugal transfer protein TraH [Amycolatopsis sp. NPDC051102]|uniref:conjugal transfer protein TraH n=1 Tax=Amycolatopsis sp. NPDC051102 TaxID=3155163 RepID=UPI0034183284